MYKNIKKHFFVVCLVLTFSCTLWGCGNKNDSQTTTNKQEETTYVGSNGEWTDAGWASEIKKSSEGDYVYVTNIKQEIDPVKGDDFYMTLSDFNISEWNMINIENFIEGTYGNICWISEDPSIAQVIDNELVAIYAGKTKISGTYGNTTVHINVTVERGGMSSDVVLNSQIVTLYPNESFQLIASERDVSYTSADSGIAKVSDDGVVTGVNPGNTTITAIHNGKQCVCKVIVSENDGSYVTVDIDTKYTITKERVLLATDRTFLILDAGVVIEDNLLKNVEILLDKIETRTGYSFTDTNDQIDSYGKCKRIVIAVGAEGAAYASDIGVMVAPYDITLEKCGANILTHELLHLVQHKNSVSCGKSITEGYAEYFGMEVYQNLPFCKNYYDEEYNSWTNFEYAFQDITLTADNIEEYLINPPDDHPISYFFVKYLVETYGENKLKEIQIAITDEFKSRFGYANSAGIHEDFSEADMFAIVKSKTSANVAKDFLVYFSKLESQSDEKRYDLSGQTGVLYENFIGHRVGSYFDFGGGYVTLSGPLVIDFTNAIDYAEKVFGRKIKGLKVTGEIIYDDNIEKVPVIYYDAAGNELEIPEYFDCEESTLPAVRVKVDKKTAGKIKLSINTFIMFDSYD